MKILTRKQEKRLTVECYDRGFHDAVASVVHAIDSGDRVVLGNGMSFVGMNNAAPMTLVGNDVHIANSVFTMDSKWKHGDNPRNNLKVMGKL